MKRAAVGVAAAVALLVPSVAHATAAHDAALARKGITHAVAKRWVKPPDAYRYRSAVTRALLDVKTLPKLRGYVLASQLSQLSPFWDSYTSPRALALFSQLEVNLDYFETHGVPTTRVDVADDDGVVYRWFPRLGLEFHPLANFGALNAAAAAEDVESTRLLADALLARAIPRGSRLIWEYQFRFAGGRPPWASGMAQAVAAQALARAYALLQDPALSAAAVRAYTSVPPFLLPLANGPWIRLYGFNSQIVLNAQLQTILSLLEYAQTSGDAEASTLAAQLSASAQALFPRFDTGDWSRYQLGGAYATREYQTFVTDLLAKPARQTQDPFWLDASQRFRAYLTVAPQVTPGSATPAVWPQPLDGYLDTAQIQFTLSQRASVTLAIGGNVTTYRLAPGARTVTWTPPQGLAPGTYPVQIATSNYAGKKATFKLPPIVVRWDTAPPTITAASLSGTTLTWQADDPGTPWLALAVDYADPTGVNPPQTQDLGQQPTGGTIGLTVPPGTWQATLRATNSAGLTATYLLGTITQPG
jgi:D-glucuronyl C5-epimerase-like protein